MKIDEIQATGKENAKQVSFLVKVSLFLNNRMRADAKKER